MKKLENKTFTEYRSGNFLVLIEENKTMFHAWITLEHAGIAEYIFGWPKKQTNGITYSNNDFINMVEENLPEYKKIFFENYPEFSE